LFFNHYRGLYGTVQKVYETTEEVAVTIDEGSLPEAIAARHSDVRLAMKTKWLESLSEEARNRLSDAEKDFKLRYTILVAHTDLRVADIAKLSSQGAVDAAQATVPEIEAPRRKTSAEIEAEEEAYRISRLQEK